MAVSTGIDKYRVHVAWIEETFSGHSLWYTRSLDFGDSFLEETEKAAGIRIGADLAHVHGTDQVVATYRSDNSTIEVQVASNHGGSWPGEGTVVSESDDSEEKRRPRIASAAPSEAVVVYEKEITTGWDIYSSRTTDLQTWFPQSFQPEPGEDDEPSTGSDQLRPAVYAQNTPAGGPAYHFVYYGGSSTDGAVFYEQSSDGTASEQEIQISADEGTTPDYVPAVAADLNQQGTAAWTSPANSGDVRFNAASTLSALPGPANLSASTTSSSIDLSWAPPTWGGSNTTYRVYRDTQPIDSLAGPDSSAVYDSTDAGVTSYVDDNVQDGTTYYYRVTAVDRRERESGFSGGVEATPTDANSGLADTSWPTFGHDLRRTGRSSTAGPKSPEIKWSTSAQHPNNRLEEPAIGPGGTVYVGAHDEEYNSDDNQHLYAFGQDGTIKWTYNTLANHSSDEQGDVSAAPTVRSDSVLYVSSNSDHLHAVNSDGTRRWATRLHFQHGMPSSPAIAGDGSVYVGTNEFELNALDTGGDVRWSTSLGGRPRSPALGPDGTLYLTFDNSDGKIAAFSPSGDQKWSRNLDGRKGYAPAVGPDGTVYVGSGEGDSGTVYAFESDGTQKWSVETGGTARSSPAIGSDGTIYIGAADGKLYAISPAGDVKWTFQAGGEIRSSPAVGGEGRIYFGVRDSTLYAVNPDGSEAWSLGLGAPVGSPAIGNEGQIYVSAGTTFYAIGGGSDSEGLADAPWPRMGGDLQTTGRSLNAGPQQGEAKWSFDAGSRVRDPSIGNDGTIYIGDADGLHAVDSSGTEKWSYSGAVSGGGNRDNVNNAPAIAEGGPLYFGSDADYAHAVGLDGQRQWVEQVCSACNIAASPAVTSDGTMYIGTNDGELYAFTPDGSVKWTFDASGRVVSPAIASDGTIYIGVGDLSFGGGVDPGKVYAINPDGSEKWSFQTDGEVKGDPAVGPDGTIYVGARDGKIYALTPEGDLEWSFDTGGQVYSSPAISDDGTIYVGSKSDAVYAINPDGTKKWSYTTGGDVRASPAIGGEGRIYVGSKDATLYAFEPDGTVAWEVDLGAPTRSSPAIGADGRIYVGAGSKLYTVGESNGVGTIADEFNDGTFEDEWQITEQDDETIRETDGHLRHESPKNYNNGGNIVSRNQAAATETVTLIVRQRQERSDYWGSGIQVRFDDGFIQLKEQKWGDNDALELRVKGENAEEKYKQLASPTSSTSWLTYRLTLDFATKTITSISRGGETYDVSVDFSGISDDTYRVVLGVGRGHRTLYDYLRTGESLNRPTRLGIDLGRTFGDASDPLDYRLVALPGAVDRPLNDAVSGDSGEEWRAYWDDGSSSDYLVEYDESDTFRFRPGRGFWLTGTQPWTVTDSIETVSLGDDEAVSVPLHDGWNIISNPLGTDVAWTDVEQATGSDLEPAWSFDGSFERVDSLQTAATGQAYYFRNDQGLNSLKIPYPNASAQRAQTVASKELEATRSAMRLTAELPVSDDTLRSAMQVGVASGAHSGWDEYDTGAPPARFSKLSLRGHPTGESAASRRGVLASDIRAAEEQNHEYPLRLRVNPEGEVVLQAGGLSSLEGRSVVLLDPTSGTSYDLRRNRSVTLSGIDSTRVLRLVVGTEAFVKQEKESITPDDVTLTSYPNPVRDRATLRYTVPEEAEVRLSVYDILGRKVATIEQEQKDAGRYRVRWQAEQLSSGVYFGRLQVGKQVVTEKLTIVR